MLDEEKVQDALRKLQDANGRGVRLHMSVGDELERRGLAVNLNTVNNGPFMKEYRAV